MVESQGGRKLKQLLPSQPRSEGESDELVQQENACLDFPTLFFFFW